MPYPKVKITRKPYKNAQPKCITCGKSINYAGKTFLPNCCSRKCSRVQNPNYALTLSNKVGSTTAGLPRQSKNGVPKIANNPISIREQSNKTPDSANLTSQPNSQNLQYCSLCKRTALTGWKEKATGYCDFCQTYIIEKKKERKRLR